MKVMMYVPKENSDLRSAALFFLIVLLVEAIMV